MGRSLPRRCQLLRRVLPSSQLDRLRKLAIDMRHMELTLATPMWARNRRDQQHLIQHLLLALEWLLMVLRKRRRMECRTTIPRIIEAVVQRTSVTEA